jgi:hypothetical protein
LEHDQSIDGSLFEWRLVATHSSLGEGGFSNAPVKPRRRMSSLHEAMKQVAKWCESMISPRSFHDDQVSHKSGATKFLK